LIQCVWCWYLCFLVFVSLWVFICDVYGCQHRKCCWSRWRTAILGTAGKPFFEKVITCFSVGGVIDDFGLKLTTAHVLLSHSQAWPTHRVAGVGDQLCWLGHYLFYVLLERLVTRTPSTHQPTHRSQISKGSKFNIRTEFQVQHILPKHKRRTAMNLRYLYQALPGMCNNNEEKGGCVGLSVV